MSVRTPAQLARFSRNACISLSVAFLAACSAGSGVGPADFPEAYRTITRTYQTQVEDLRAQGQANAGTQGLDRIIEVYEGIRDATETARAGYSELDPPDGIASAFRRIIGNLEQQVTVLDRMIGAARDGSLDQTMEAAGELSELTSAWITARNELETHLGETAPGGSG